MILASTLRGPRGQSGGPGELRSRGPTVSTPQNEKVPATAGVLFWEKTSPRRLKEHCSFELPRAVQFDTFRSPPGLKKQPVEARSFPRPRRTGICKIAVLCQI